MFIAALFLTAPNWKQPNCPLTEMYIKKFIFYEWNIHREYYSTIKRNIDESKNNYAV